MKKRLSLFVALLILIMVFAGQVLAEQALTIKVESIVATPGDTVTVKILLQNNPGFNTLGLQIEPDSRLELVGLDFEPKYDSGLDELDPKNPAVTLISGKGYYDNDSFLVLTVKVKESASLGAATIELKNVEAFLDAGDGTDGEKPVPVNTVPGTITIQAAPHDHDWGTGTVTTPATCARKGERTFTCGICGETKTEDIPTLPHTPETRNAVAPTCTTPGKEADTVCAVCNTVIETGAALPATGHDWDEGTVTTAPTCTDDGEKKVECMTCGEEKTEVIPATGHSWDAGTVTTAPTCTDDGQADYTCTVCGESETRSLKATGHSWKQDKVLTEASCDKPGEVHLVCETCGEEKTEAIPASGHSWDAGQQTVAPTVGKAGEKTYTCAICGAKRTEAIPALSPEPTKPAEIPAASPVSPNTNSGATLLWMLLLLLGGGSVAAATYRKKLRG